MKWLLNKKKFLFAIIPIAIIILIVATRGGSSVTYDTVTAERQPLLEQKISATGRIKAVDEVDLAFEKSGRVGDVLVSVGDTVEKGQPLVTLESAEAVAEVAQANAAVESAKAMLDQYQASLLNQEAKLAELKAGTRPEEITLYESKVTNANASLLSAKEGMIDAMQDAYTRSEDAVRNKSDDMINSPKSQSPDLKFTTTNASLRSEILTLRIDLEGTLTAWKADLNALTSASDLDPAIAETKSDLDEVKLFLEKLAIALSGALTSSTVSETTLDTWKTTISTARTSINTAIQSHTSAKEKLTSAETALEIAQNELTLKQASSTPEQIDAQEAAVEQAKANVVSQQAQIAVSESAAQAAEARYAKNILRAPFSGVVTKQDAKVGAIVAPNQTIASVISQGNFEIEALIVEADIAGLEVGDKATLTLDAYGDDVVFDAVVTKIDPAAELVEGVANYNTTLQLTGGDEKLKAGMTADLDIVTDEKENVIAIPQRAVIFKDNKKIVRILDGDTVREVEVETGIRGEKGLIEIVSGVEEGDTVITAVND